MLMTPRERVLPGMPGRHSQPGIDSPEEEARLKAAMVAEIRSRYNKMLDDFNKGHIDRPIWFSQIMREVMEKFGVSSTSLDDTISNSAAEKRHAKYHKYLNWGDDLKDIRDDSQDLLKTYETTRAPSEREITGAQTDLFA